MLFNEADKGYNPNISTDLWECGGCGFLYTREEDADDCEDNNCYEDDDEDDDYTDEE